MYGAAAASTGIESCDALHLPAFFSVGDRSAALRTKVAFPRRPWHAQRLATLSHDNERSPVMGVEEKLPSGVLLTTVEGVAGYMRKASFWPATFGLACCAIEMMTSGGPKYDLARFGMEVFRASPRQADLMIVAGRVSQKMAPVLRQIYDQMAEPKWVLAMGVCASSGGMFNNYAIVQGVDHVVPVDMYLPGCPPRPEMLIDAILKLHDQVQSTKFGANRLAQIEELEGEALRALPTSQMRGLLR
jgi:NADH-quinone oxidoreductase subunit B